MKVSELFEEAIKVSHGKIVNAIIGLAAKHLKIDAAHREDMRDLIAGTDEFWAPEIDAVTHEVERYLDGRGSMDEVLDAAGMALDGVGQNMVEYYRNAWNHAPGYQKPAKLSFDAESISDKEIIAAIHLAVPGFKEHHAGVVKKQAADDKARDKAEAASVTPEDIKKIAEFINKNWEKSYGPKMQAQLTKNAKQFDMPEGEYKSEQDIINAFKDFSFGGKKYTQLNGAFEWVWNGADGKAPEKIYTVYHTPALLKKVAALVPGLRGLK